MRGMILLGSYFSKGNSRIGYKIFSDKNSELESQLVKINLKN